MKLQIKSPVNILIAGLIFVGCKIYFPSAEINFFKLLIWPVAWTIGVVLGSPIQYVPEIGYFLYDYNILIDKSCSGYNFFLLSFMIFVITLTLKIKNKVLLISIIPISIFLSYFLTLLANTSRILISIFLPRSSVLFGWIPSQVLHESIGVFCFLCFLIIATLVLEKFLSGSQTHV